MLDIIIFACYNNILYVVLKEAAMVFSLKGCDAQNKHQAYGAWLNALERDKEAKDTFPVLNQTTHLNNIQQIKNETINWLGFKEILTLTSSNYYQNARTNLKGIGLGTSLVFRLSGQRNFTPTDAINLENHLKNISSLTHLIIEVGHNPITPRCVVHVGL